MRKMITFRAYEPEQDELQVYQLWQRMLSDSWPIPRETFHAVIVANEDYQPGDHLAAIDDRGIMGFVATQVPQRQNNLILQGKILVILMAPEYLGEGFGRELLDRAIAALKQQGVGEVQLGGGSIYFWQGVPTNLLSAWLFFEHLGWPEQERSFDLIGDLRDYATPQEVYERLRPSITIGLATPDDREAILQFESEHFPGWLPFYERVLRHNGYADIVVAKDTYEGVVGISSILDPRALWWHYDIRWLHLFPEHTGGIGPLGVAETMREKGIGLALAARVTEELRNRGFVKSYVGWTWLVDWYGKLGYKVWQEYIMSWRKM
jgi:beta-N-acetylhexosaminidase